MTLSAALQPVNEAFQSVETRIERIYSVANAERLISHVMIVDRVSVLVGAYKGFYVSQINQIVFNQEVGKSAIRRFAEQACSKRP